MRSFRSTLALRVAFVALGLALLIGLGAALLLRARLLANLDASLLSIAEFETDYGAEPASPEFRFRSNHLGQGSERRYWAQLLGADGVPVLLSVNLKAPLPVPAKALTAAEAGEVGFATHQGMRTIMYPLGRRLPIHRQHLLQISTGLEAYRAALGNFGAIAGGAGLVMAGIAGIGSLVIARRALTPALALTRDVEAIGGNELGRRVSVPGELREFHGMAVAFNSLLERIEAAVKGTRRFTADASHELRGPLTVLRGELELALSRPRTPGEYEEVLGRCLDEVLRLARLADDLLTLARVEGGVIGGARSRLDLDDLVSRAVEKESPLAGSRMVALEVTGTAGEVAADSDLLLRAVSGLLEHAIMASPEGGRVRVRLGPNDGAQRTLVVTDNGAGLKPDEVSGVFQRFYRWNRARTRSAESGLGLAIARAVAERHGGSLQYLGNDPGASFQLSLPAAAGDDTPRGSE